MIKYKEENLIGKRFDRLVVEKEVRINNLRYFLCKCDCGKEKLVRFGNLMCGAIRSCGCLRKEIVKENAKKMGVKNRKEMFYLIDHGERYVFAKTYDDITTWKFKKSKRLFELLVEYYSNK